MTHPIAHPPLEWPTVHAREAVEACCREHGLTIEDLIGRRTAPAIVALRHEAARRLRAMGLSYPEVARAVGYASHGAVHEAINGRNRQ